MVSDDLFSGAIVEWQSHLIFSISIHLSIPSNSTNKPESRHGQINDLNHRLFYDQALKLFVCCENASSFHFITVQACTKDKQGENRYK